MAETSALIEALEQRAVQARFESIETFSGRDAASDRVTVVSEPLPMHKAIVAWQRIDANPSSERPVGAVLVEPLAWESFLSEPSREPRLASIEAFRPELRADAHRRLTEVVTQLRALLRDGQTLEALAPSFDLEALSAWENGDKLAIDDLLSAQEEGDEGDDSDDSDSDDEPAKPSGSGLLLAPPLYAPGVSERTVLQALASRAGMVHLVAFEGPSVEAFDAVGFGAFNDCPPPNVHSLHFHRWNAAHRARPLLLGAATIDAVLSRPPTTIDQAIELVATQLAYAPDTVGDSFAVALISALDCGGWGFYWD